VVTWITRIPYRKHQQGRGQNLLGPLLRNPDLDVSSPSHMICLLQAPAEDPGAYPCSCAFNVASYCDSLDAGSKVTSACLRSSEFCHCRYTLRGILVMVRK